MKRMARVVQAIGVNGVVAFGIFGGPHWTVATVILLYWCENALGIEMVALRFRVHRALTHKRGHRRQILANFLGNAGLFTLWHSMFMASIVFLILSKTPEALNAGQFIRGLGMVAAVLVASFVIDLIDMKNMPFAALRAMAEAYGCRTLVVHFTILFGMFAMAMMENPRALLAVFIVLKTLAELPWSGAPTLVQEPEAPPAWFIRHMTKLGAAPTARMEEKWKEEREKRLRLAVEDELPA